MKMGQYDPIEALACLIYQLKKGQKLAGAGGQTIADCMMVSKGITVLEKTKMFSDGTRKWRQQYTGLKMWETFRTFFRQSHREQKIS